jgi:hypothetical protein
VTNVMPAFAPVALFLLLATFMVSWDGLVRRHVRFTALSTDLHLRDIPAVSVGLVSLLLLVLSCATTAQRLPWRKPGACAPKELVNLSPAA